MLTYYIKLIYYKITAFLHCKNYKLRIFVNEIHFLIYALKKDRNLKAYSTKEKYLKTKYGNYHIRDIMIDWIIASPAFERQDIDALLSKVSIILKSKKKAQKVYFLDIGASIGKYTVEVGRKYKHIQIYSFEPDPEAYKLLNKNIKTNKLNNIHIKKVALSSTKSKKTFYFYEPMKMLVSFFKTDKKIILYTDTLDNVLFKKIRPTDILIIKIDVEGHEYEVLKGAKKLIKNNKNIYLLLEDFGLKSSRKNLAKLVYDSFMFEKRITPYNSFWVSK